MKLFVGWLISWLLLFWGRGEGRDWEKGGNKGLRDCVVIVWEREEVCACVWIQGRGAGWSEISNALLNQVVSCCNVLYIAL